MRKVSRWTAARLEQRGSKERCAKKRVERVSEGTDTDVDMPVWGGANGRRYPLCERARAMEFLWVRNAKVGVRAVGPINEHCTRRQWMIMAMLKAGGWGGAISCREPLCECAHLICRSYVRNAEEGVQTVGPINEHCIKRQWLIMAAMIARKVGGATACR